MESQFYFFSAVRLKSGGTRAGRTARKLRIWLMNWIKYRPIRISEGQVDSYKNRQSLSCDRSQRQTGDCNNSRFCSTGDISDALHMHCIGQTMSKTRFDRHYKTDPTGQWWSRESAGRWWTQTASSARYSRTLGNWTRQRAASNDDSSTPTVHRCHPAVQYNGVCKTTKYTKLRWTVLNWNVSWVAPTGVY